jgi:hypothetical protein
MAESKLIPSDQSAFKILKPVPYNKTQSLTYTTNDSIVHIIPSSGGVPQQSFVTSRVVKTGPVFIPSMNATAAPAEAANAANAATAAEAASVASCTSKIIPGKMSADAHAINVIAYMEKVILMNLNDFCKTMPVNISKILLTDINNYITLCKLNMTVGKLKRSDELNKKRKLEHPGIDFPKFGVGLSDGSGSSTAG